MIPLGVLASAHVPVSGGAAIVQLKSAASSTVTLDTAPTPGNLLVIAAANGVTDPSAWTYSHSLSLDVAHEASGWDAALASGIVQTGDSATITVTGMNASYVPAITAYEISGAMATASTDSADGGSSVATSVTGLDVPAGLVAIAAVIWSANITSNSAAATDMTKDYSDRRGAMFSVVAPSLPFTTEITWATGRNAAAVIGGYA